MFDILDNAIKQHIIINRIIHGTMIGSQQLVVSKSKQEKCKMDDEAFQCDHF